MAAVSMPATVAVGAAGWAPALLEAFSAGGSPDPALQAVRQQATRALAERALPSRRDEAWRFTDIAPFRPSPRHRSVLRPLPAPACPRLRPGWCGWCWMARAIRWRG